MLSATNTVSPTAAGEILQVRPWVAINCSGVGITSIGPHEKHRECVLPRVGLYGTNGMGVSDDRQSSGRSGQVA